METKDGGHCKANVECKDGYKKELPEDDKNWKQCRVGGENKFNDPQIGDFSITFTEKDGAGQGEGLTTPILKLKVRSIKSMMLAHLCLRMAWLT